MLFVTETVMINNIVFYFYFSYYFQSKLDFLQLLWASTIYLCFLDHAFQIYFYCTSSNLECQN